MALKFYLHQIDEQHEIHCNTNSTITEIAGSFDLGTLELEWNECEHSIFPGTKIFILNTSDNSIFSFIVSQDNVEVVKKTKPVKYFHTLTISQNTGVLSKKYLRNTIFQQPYNYQQKYNKRMTFVNYVRYDEDGEVESYDTNMNFDRIYNTTTFLSTSTAGSRYTISLKDSRRKFKNAYIKVDTFLTFFTEEGREEGTTIVGYKSPQNNFINDKVVSVSFWFVNKDDDNDKLLFTVNSSSINRKIKLTSEQLNWMKNKNFYILFNTGETSDLSNIVYFNDPSSKEANVCGYINVELYIESYYYSLWDVLDIINKQYIKQYNNGSLQNLYTMPDKTTGKGLELDSIIAPEFSFTQSNIFNAVAQVLSYIDAFPVLSENNELDFVYLNDLSGEKINNLNVADKKVTLNEENFTNKLLSYYQNAKQENAINYPAKRTFKYVGSANYGIVDKNDYWFLLERPIDYIDKLLVRISNFKTNVYMYHGTVEEATFIDFPYLPEGEIGIVDISPALFEKTIYDNLENGIPQESYPTKNNSLYYTKGDNKIYAGKTDRLPGTVGQSDVLEWVLNECVPFSLGKGYNYTSVNYQTDDKQKCRFNCIYHSVYNGIIEQESSVNKFEGSSIVSQNNSSIDLNKVGNYLQGLISRLGNEEKTITFPLTSFSNKAKLGSYFYDNDGNKWILNRIKTTFSTKENNVIINGTFTKDFNSLAQFTSLNQEKRFYDISTKLTTTGYENINEFLYFTNRNINDLTSIAENIALTNYGVDLILTKTFKGIEETSGSLPNSNGCFEYAYINCEEESSSITTYIYNHTYGNGNQICFEMGFESPINAGDRVVVESDDSFVGKTSLYTVESGFTDKITIRGMTYSGFHLLNRSFPLNPEQIGSGLDILNINNYYYYKKPNEILHLNYALCFMPYWRKTIDNLGTPIYKYDEIFFGDKFINENGIIPNAAENNFGDFYLYVSDEKYSIIDNKAFGTNLGLASIDIDLDYQVRTNYGVKTYGNIEAKINNSSVDISNYESWCLADEFGNVYLAVNKSDDENGFTTAKVIFFTSRFRKV